VTKKLFDFTTTNEGLLNKLDTQNGNRDSDSLSQSAVSSDSECLDNF
jgi:hypothetical protein